jgi:3-keto-5-aminohexanoate cleavage enzyme
MKGELNIMAEQKKFAFSFWKSKGDDDLEEILVRIASKHPIELDEQINTLSKPLIIENACPGWQSKMWAPPRAYPVKKPPNYKEGGVRFPAVPVTFEDQAQIQIDAIKAGCAAVHIHARDPKDGFGSEDLKLLTEVYDRILAKVDAVSMQHSWIWREDLSLDYITEAKKLLEMGQGNRYCQGAVVLWPVGDSYAPNYAKDVQEGVRFMEENDLKPIQKIRSSYHLRQFQRVLVDTGVLTKKPYVLVHDMGHPFGWPMDQDPWWPVEMITSLVQTKQRMGEDCVIGVTSGGRNWMPITMMAIMAGVDIVRVGIEDCYWMYPHLDEVIQRNQDTVEKIVTFCKLIGRPLASPEQARKILGIKLTSPPLK